MRIEPTPIAGTYVITPRLHEDDRGLFLEWYRGDHLAEHSGQSMELAQANLSVSAAGTVRGIHFADVPPGQAKYVTCVRGAVLDVVVDVREGSPTFGRWTGIPLDDIHRRAVFLDRGLGHGFCALTPDATVLYLTSSIYNPAAEHAVHPLDPELAIDWPTDRPVLSPRDAAAPPLSSLRARGALPGYAYQKVRSSDD